MVDFEFLFIYLQLWRNYAILSVTTQFTSCAQNVHHRPKRTLAFADIFPKRLGIVSPKFTRLLNVDIYARIQIFIQLFPIVMKLLSATTLSAFQPLVDILSIWWWSRLIWHNFVKVADNWIKFCIPAYIGTYNRRVKFWLKIPNRLGKNVRIFLLGGVWLPLYTQQIDKKFM